MRNNVIKVEYCLHTCLLYSLMIVKLFVRNNIGCNVGFACVSIFLYADDIILLAPSVEALQQMINLCEQQLSSLDVS